MFIGRRIAKLRMERGISQTKLAKGIVSAQHLSNIEVGRYQPGDDTLILLSKKLSVPTSYLVQNDSINQELEKLFNDSKEGLNSNLDSTKANILIIKEKYTYVFSIYQEVLLYLIESCFLMKIGELARGIQTFNEQFMPLIKNTELKELSNEIKELYYCFKGMESYFNQDYHQSNVFYFHQLQYANDKVKGNLNYNISLNYLKLMDLINAIYYAETAQKYYEQLQQKQNIAELLNYLGVLYWENNDIDNSIQHLNKALELVDKTNNLMQARIYHNIGLTLKSNNNIPSSLDFFKKSLKLKKHISKNHCIVTYRSLLSAYLSSNLIDEAYQTLQEAYEFCNDDTDRYHLKVIEGNIKLRLNNDGEYEKYLREAIDYFHKNKQWRYLLNITEELGKHYLKKRKYKLSSQYLLISLEAHKKVSKKGKGVK